MRSKLLCFYLLLVKIPISFACENGFEPFEALSSSEIETSEIAISAAVTLVNVEAEQRIEQAIIQFELDLIELAKKPASRESLMDWYSNMRNLNKLGFEAIDEMEFLSDSKLKRFALTTVNTIVAGWVSRALALTGHEVAHSDAATSAGQKTSFAHDATGDKNLSVGSLFTTLLSKPGTPYTYHDGENITPAQEAMISAAGLNYQTQLSSDIAQDSLKSGRTHVSEAFDLLYNKAGVGIYYYQDQTSSSSDLRNYVDSLVAQGHISTGQEQNTIDKLAKYNVLTTLLSGSTVNSLKAQADYIKKGNTSTENLSFKTPLGDVSLPEFDTYLNQTGVSVRSSIALKRPKGSIYQVSYEKAVVGLRTGSEVGLGAYTPISDKTYIEGHVRYNTRSNTYGGRVELGYEMGSGWQLVSGVEYDNGTQEGLRRYFTQDDDKSKLVGFLRVRKSF